MLDTILLFNNSLWGVLLVLGGALVFIAIPFLILVVIVKSFSILPTLDIPKVYSYRGMVVPWILAIIYFIIGKYNKAFDIDTAVISLLILFPLVTLTTGLISLFMKSSRNLQYKYTILIGSSYSLACLFIIVFLLNWWLQN